MNQNRRLLEETTRMKKLMSIKDVNVVSEETAESKLNTYFNDFHNATRMWGTNWDKIIAVLNQIPDKKTFIDFVNLYNKKTRSTFWYTINDEGDSGNGADVFKIHQLLKSKFNIDTDPGLGGKSSLPAGQRPFEKKFKLINYNIGSSQQQAGYTQPQRDEDSGMIVTKTGPNATDFVVTKPGETPPPEWKPEQAKKETTTSSPQTYNDVLSGKGVLKTGVTSPAVGELQQKLLDLGYSAIAKPTNYFGTETFNAVKDFQQKNSLTVDGKVGGNTSKKIDQILDIRKRRSASQGEVVPGVPDTKLPDTSISGLSNQKSTTTTTTTSPNTRGLTIFIVESTVWSPCVDNVN